MKKIRITLQKKTQDTYCNICMQSKKLTWDHVPPQKCSIQKYIEIDQLHKRLKTGNSFEYPLISQNGLKFKTICSKCNNEILSEYDCFLKELCLSIRRYLESSLEFPPTVQISAKPNAIIRAILGHLLSTKLEIDKCIFDKEIRPCILDKSIPVPANIHIFYWIYPYEENTVIIRDFAMPSVRGKFKDFGFFQLIKFYPVAFLISNNVKSYENMFSLNRYNNIRFDKEVKINIPLGERHTYDWPERIDSTNAILLGKTGGDAVFSKSRKKRK